MRQPLPTTRSSLTRENTCGELKFYVTVSFYADEPCRPGEVFVHVAKEGSTLGGLCSSLALAISIGLQHGVPWPELAKHFDGAYFLPQGASLDPQVEYRSIVHAISHTISLVIEDRNREFNGKSLVEKVSRYCKVTETELDYLVSELETKLGRLRSNVPRPLAIDGSYLEPQSLSPAPSPSADEPR